VARGRTDWLIDLARGIKIAGSGWGVSAEGLVLVVALMALRRWHHLLVYLGSLAVLKVVGGILYRLGARPRPFGITALTGWGGYATGSPPVSLLTLVFLAMAFTLVPAGRPRQIAALLIAPAILLVGASRVFLGIDHPTDVLGGVFLAGLVTGTMFRLLAPDETFPVRYRRGRTAHLDVGGRRGEAIAQALREQLGVDVTEVKPFGLKGSGGSSPLRLRIAGNPETYLFAKLYARNHVWADLWYKLVRQVLYGRLEDESPFQSVRRFVEYEDYTLRLLWDAGVPTAQPYGFVEVSPDREYMLVTGFFKGAIEISEAEVTDDIIDQGMAVIRRLWDIGVAHRDIKPANLLVLEGRLLIIDCAFAQVRPSPWRQAVDLANMALVLAIHTDAQRVYERALRYFSPEELSEAFAATWGVASPTQLRQSLKADGRNLLERFRALAPARPPIALQRWSLQRVVLAIVLLGVGGVMVLGAFSLYMPEQDPAVATPTCGTGSTMVLMAQSVPSAALLPCVAALPTGWTVENTNVRSGGTAFIIKVDADGNPRVTVSLAASCHVEGALEVPSDQAGVRRFERTLRVVPSYFSLRYGRFAGGCVTYRFALHHGTQSSIPIEVDGAISLMPRTTLVEAVRRSEGLTLCGAGAPCRP
jgi:membrane-associated phospholipid phosphatase